MSFAGGFIDLFGNGDKSRITKRNGKEVKGFIEYKERDEGLRVLRAVESIVCVLQSPDGDVFIRKSEEQLKISAAVKRIFPECERVSLSVISWTVLSRK